MGFVRGYFLGLGDGQVVIFWLWDDSAFTWAATGLAGMQDSQTGPGMRDRQATWTGRSQACVVLLKQSHVSLSLPSGTGICGNNKVA